MYDKLVDFFYDKPKEYEQIKSIISSLLKSNPNDRPTASSLLNDPFFTKCTDRVL